MKPINEKVKIFLIVLVTIGATLFIERFIYSAIIYNPIYTDEAILDFYLNGSDKKYHFSKKDVFYKTKVDPNLSILENMYNVEKKLEAQEFIGLGCDPENHPIDSKSLHDGFMELKTKFNWDYYNEQRDFNDRIREALSIDTLKNFYEYKMSTILDETKNGRSAYVIYNSLYSKSNHHKDYYMLQMYLQNKNDFIYINNFRWGKVLKTKDDEKLKNMVWDKFDEIFQSCN